MSDDPPSLGKQTEKIFNVLKMQAPGAIEAIAKTLTPMVQQQVAAEQAVAPEYQELYKQNQLAAAGTEADVVEGPGQRLVSAADKYQQQLDPEFYKSRGMISDALGSYLGAYSPTELSPTELAQISRGINATTGPVTPSAMNTIRNAQVFGEAGTKRWQNFGDAVTRAASVIPNLKSGLTGFDIATYRGQDTGARNAVQSSLAPSFGFATSALGDITGTNAQREAKKTTLLQDILMGTQAFANVGSGIGGMMKTGAPSDVNLKENFNNVDPTAILERLMTIPVSAWNYKTDKTRHIGPMAQDFKAAFGFGASGKFIEFVDANGVLIAAVQGLYAKVLELQKQIQQLKG